MKHKRFKKTASTYLQEWIDHCIAKGPKRIIRSSLPKAELVPFEYWQILLRTQQPSLKELLLSDDNRGELVIPKRGRCRSPRNINFI